jgi:iron donor protein CyaY
VGNKKIAFLVWFNVLNINMNDAEFDHAANATLSAMLDVLEPEDDAGALEVEFQAGVMSITLADRRQFIINKHAPTKQLWLSSPVSGGLHFSFDADSKEWVLPDGRLLCSILTSELQNLAGIKVVF